MTTTLTHDDLIGIFSEMTLTELHNFIGLFEETFGVTAAAAVAVPLPAAPQEPDEPEQDEFTVVLTGAGDRKIQVIKALREITSLGLKEAKDASETLPFTVMTAVPRDAAQAAAARLTAAGGVAEVR